MQPSIVETHIKPKSELIVQPCIGASLMLLLNHVHLSDLDVVRIDRCDRQQVLKGTRVLTISVNEVSRSHSED